MGRHQLSGTEKEKNKERRQSFRTIEEQFAEPPPYSLQTPSAQASSSNIECENPQRKANPAFEKLDFTPSPLELPTTAECIAHLKLLHAFAKLRHEIGNHDDLYRIGHEKFEDARETPDSSSEASPIVRSQQPEGIHRRDGNGAISTDTSNALSEEEKEEATLAERVREKQWSIFVTNAVYRFEKWWESWPYTNGPVLRTTDFDSSHPALPPLVFTEHGKGLDDQIENCLPPLDVLMVWHAYMLNPRAYLEDCMQWSKPRIWHTAFPWRLIHDSIDNTTFDYHPSERAVQTFEKTTRLQWDYLKSGPIPIVCPKCSIRFEIPLTRPPSTSDLAMFDSYLTCDTGFAGAAFKETCFNCNLLITHEKLRVGKFINDAASLLYHKRPLPGTILNAQGMPEATAKNKRIGTHDPFFPNRVVENLPEFHPTALRFNIEKLSVETLKSMFQGIMASPAKIKRVNAEQYKSDLVAKDSKIAVRKMLSHYWDNSSPFGLDLVGAVIRQSSFVQKMRRIDWLHSPSAMTTMQRLIVKYHRFVRLIADNPKKIAVPTLDIDLAWHTHQLTPKTYYHYTVAETKKFLNHDDKIPENSLHTSFQWTAQAYEKKYGQPYSECACWYCECTREPLRSSFTNRVNPFRASTPSIAQLAEKGFPKDPLLGPHVSAHNALAMGASGSAQERRRALEELDLQYAKVRKRYQKKKREGEVPEKGGEAYVYGAYGYPLYYPVYVPYYAEPTCEGDRYSSSSGGGGCAAGTCAASASLGSCAGGAGTPGCKASCGGHGDASGGCGNCGGGDGGGCGGGCGG